FGAVIAVLMLVGVMVEDFDFSPLKMLAAQRPEYKRELLARVRAVPGVGAAAEAVIVPMSGSAWDRFIDIPERGIHRRTVNVNVVSDQFFRTMEVPMLAGR